MAQIAEDYDPLEVFTRAPANETPSERRVRKAMDAKAKERSDDIEQMLETEGRKLRSSGEPVRVLLLGQSGSGKSALIRSIQMTYDPKWQSNLINWRPIIHLNLLNNVITILDAIQVEENVDPSTITPSQQLLKRRLTHLRGVEADLKRRLGLGIEEAADGPEVINSGSGDRTTHSGDVSEGMGGGRGLGGKWTNEARSWTIENAAAALEASLRSNGRDRARVDEVTEAITKSCGDIVSLWNDEGVRALLRSKKITLETDTGFFLDDTKRIAQHNYTPSNRDVLRAQIRTRGVHEYHIRSNTLQKFKSGGTFVDGLVELLPRLMLPHSLPSLRSSHTIRMPFTSKKGELSIRLNMRLPHQRDSKWIFYKMGGGLTDAKKGWIPFFVNMDAIVILAPLSAFDERLAEGSHINKLEHSFHIWRTVCSSPILADITLILIMNKCDLLDKKLKAGTRVVDYVPTYGTERSNDAVTVTKYFRDEFVRIRGREARYRGNTHYHIAPTLTNSQDTRTTRMILGAVADGFFTSLCKETELL